MRNGIRRTLGAAVAAVLLGLAGTASAAPVAVLTDRFTDGNPIGGSDPLGGAFYGNANGGTTSGSTSVTTDGTLPARGEPNNNVLVFTPGNATFQSVVAAFSTQTLAVGDSVSLSFDFRFTTAPANGGAFRLGLYNSAGSPPTSSADQTSAKGYYVSVNTGATSSGATAFREDGGTPAILGGLDRTSLGTAATAQNVVGDTAAHTAVITLTRTAAGTISVFSQIDSTTVANNLTDAAAPTFTFDELAISPAGNAGALNIDNVVVTSTVPEPGVIGMGVVAAGAGLARRRRRA